MDPPPPTAMALGLMGVVEAGTVLGGKTMYFVLYHFQGKGETQQEGKWLRWETDLERVHY